MQWRVMIWFMYMTLISIAAALVSLAVWKVLGSPSLKQWKMAAFLAALTSALVGSGFAVISVGTLIGQNSALTFKEYWNGYETSTYSQARECTRDGNCAHTYSCDPYEVVETETYTDSKGNLQTRTVIRTHWHQCPISTQETSYYIGTTLGDITVASNLMTGDEWRAGEAIPGGKQTAPQLWLDAKARVDSNRPGAVTERHDYKNYIQASDRTVFNKYEGSIETYLAQGLLPAPAKASGPYGVAKAYNVNGAVDNADFSEYVIDVSSINALFGDRLYGDLHVVFVPSTVQPDEYKNSLSAYWSSTRLLGKDTASKNTFVAIFGVDGDTVKWARAFTGMPIGNTALIQDITNLKNAKVDSSLLGRPGIDLTTDKMVSSDGRLEGLLWGTHKFERVSMSGDGDESGGFSYLRGDIEVTTTTYVASFAATIVVWALILWGAFAFSVTFLLDDRPAPRRSSDDYPTWRENRRSSRVESEFRRGYGSNGKAPKSNRW